MPDAESLAQRLRARRLALDLTLAETAERAGLSLPYVSNLERGRGNPTMEALRSLADALDMPIKELIGGEGADSVVDPVDLIMADAPKSLTSFSRTKQFADAVEKLAAMQGSETDEMRRRLLVAMTSAPRRSSGEPTPEDWRRLLDVYSLILSE